MWEIIQWLKKFESENSTPPASHAKFEVRLSAILQIEKGLEFWLLRDRFGLLVFNPNRFKEIARRVVVDRVVALPCWEQR